MNVNTIVIDDFLENPMWVRQSALAAMDYAVSQEFYPGVRTDPADLDYQEYVKKKLEIILNEEILEWHKSRNIYTGEWQENDNARFQLCTEKDETWVHVDPNEWTAIIFLTPNAPAESGTGIYRHKESKVYTCTQDAVKNLSGDWELITFVGNVFNRVILFKGNLCHRSVMPGFGHDKDTGRLTQVFFFNTNYDRIGKENGKSN